MCPPFVATGPAREPARRAHKPISSAANAAVAALMLAVATSAASGQTTVNGSSFALRSSGALSGASDWQLTQNGYVGTYVTLASPGTVSFSLNASGVTDGAAPRMNIAVDDFKTGWDVASGFNSYNTSVYLPAGTHFVRTEYANDVPTAASRSLTVRSVQFTGATVSNSSTDALALAASQTYIDNYRKGPGHASLTGPGGIPLLSGTQVAYDMKRNAFNFGGTVSGTSTGDSKYMLANNPAVGTEANQFQQFINQYFNCIVPSNAAKWAYNEATQNSVTMSTVDTMLNYAQSHNMRARQHNLIWGSGATSGNQQPSWVNSLISSAVGGSATAKTNLRNAIGTFSGGSGGGRINYYVGTNGNRATKFVELDVLNEAQHQPSYWNIYGNTPGSGSMSIASIYSDVAAAAAAAGNPNLRLYINEFNVIQYSPNTISSTGAQSGSDQYANWYRGQAEAIINAGGALSGVGIQEYTDLAATGSNVHSAATIQKALQNLSIPGLAISMTEWGMGSNTTTVNRETLGPGALDSAMRMFYGNPLATSFMMWGWWDTSGNTAPAQMIVTTPGNATYTIKPLGQKWIDLMNEFATHGVATVNPDGSIDFSGYYGDYNIGNQSGFSNLELLKGTTGYSLQLAAPPQWSLWNPANSGNWSTAGNWTTGGVADAVGQTAYFGPSAFARSVSVDGPRTLGMLAFNSGGTYTLSGSGGTVTLDGPAGATAIYAVLGSHSIDAPLVLNDDVTVTVTSAASTVSVSNLQDSTRTITKNGPGTLAVNAFRAGALSVNAGTVALLPGASNAGSVAVVSVSAGAAVDLTDNDLLVSTTPKATIESHVAAHRITSSLSTPASATGLGVLGGDEYLALGNTNFDGSPVATTDTLVKYTWNGDANFDGRVTFDDYVKIDTGFNTGLTGWLNGDFNYSGAVNFDDYVLIDIAFNQQNGTLGRAIDWISGDNRALADLSDPAIETMLGHLDQFGSAYGAAFLAAVPEPCLTILPLVTVATAVRRRRRNPAVE